ncbi:triose-phosphate isomerase [Acidaminobacter hydrogenoformans]|uniref:Triosephosphate isomerase n=1 Tax=Acidaminobacter hydrogenoformans DSM 2784 TaxID=1120920 RepID=A0A1G5S552_9FIRM|nr:triose-phosphate isomerase [Acidaminobacter hydrogenoformans]SCZ80970.1 triosephosphate isomerase [Acidaminobacter hydrogenoformans DSM 2784]
MRKPIIAGNWKMHMTIESGKAFVKEVAASLGDTEVEVVLCVPFTLIQPLSTAAEGTPVKIAAQNMHYEDFGAFTGEVSADMLKEVGATYVVIGHSERRQYFNETDETVNLKLKKAHASGLKPIVCCGETLEEREAGTTESVVKRQVEAAFEGISPELAAETVVAYEPVWAIGTGRTATAAQAQEVIAYIRSLVEAKYGDEVSEEMRIQYGGSVKPDNVEEIMNEVDIDGALVGGASLKPDSFLSLVNF